MEELDFINKHLGGHKITIRGVKTLATKPVLQIAEIGCGGGDNLRIIKNWCNKKNISATLTGIDINPDCIRFANERASNKDIFFIRNDYRLVEFDSNPDIIFSSLFCHHFSNEELIKMMQWMFEHSKLGFFINDLHRHPFAFHSIRILTNTFSKSYMVKHDAPLSVRRGLARKEWETIFSQAGIKNYTIEWQWAFRWLIICFK